MRSKTGVVVSNKMDQTIVVAVSYSKSHPIYKKPVSKTHKFYAHDPENKYQEGDKVTIYECPPMSKTKRWTVVEPTQEAKAA